METIITHPGLHHLAEKVFCNLDGEDLRTCAQMNQFCKQIFALLLLVTNVVFANILIRVIIY